MSRDIRDFQMAEFRDDFYDPLNDSSIESGWTVDMGGLGSSSVVEDGTSLTITDSGGSALEWQSGGLTNAPNISRAIEPYNFTAKVWVLCSEGGVNGNEGGLIHYNVNNETQFNAIGVSYDGTSNDLHTFNGSGNNQWDNIFSTGGWIAIVRRNLTVYYYYLDQGSSTEPSLDDMIYYRNLTENTPYLNGSRIALVAQVRAPNYPAINIKFQNFRITYP